MLIRKEVISLTYTLSDVYTNDKGEVFVITNLSTHDVREIDTVEYITLKNRGEID